MRRVDAPPVDDEDEDKDDEDAALELPGSLIVNLGAPTRILFTSGVPSDDTTDSDGVSDGVWLMDGDGALNEDGVKAAVE
jgi:hypothetical protein